MEEISVGTNKQGDLVQFIRCASCGYEYDWPARDMQDRVCPSCNYNATTRRNQMKTTIRTRRFDKLRTWLFVKWANLSRAWGAR